VGPIERETLEKLFPAGRLHRQACAARGHVPATGRIYSPPNHPDGTVHKTKRDADAAELRLGGV